MSGLNHRSDPQAAASKRDVDSHLCERSWIVICFFVNQQAQIEPTIVPEAHWPNRICEQQRKLDSQIVCKDRDLEFDGLLRQCCIQDEPIDMEFIHVQLHDFKSQRELLLAKDATRDFYGLLIFQPRSDASFRLCSVEFL